MCKKSVLYFGKDSVAFTENFSIIPFRGEISSKTVTFHLPIPKIDGIIVDSLDSKTIHQIFNTFKNLRFPILIWTSSKLDVDLKDILNDKEICILSSYTHSNDKSSILLRQLEITPFYDCGVFFSNT